jgi:hypothetical protein
VKKTAFPLDALPLGLIPPITTICWAEFGTPGLLRAVLPDTQTFSKKQGGQIPEYDGEAIRMLNNCQDFRAGKVTEVSLRRFFPLRPAGRRTVI